MRISFTAYKAGFDDELALAGGVIGTDSQNEEDYLTFQTAFPNAEDAEDN